MMSRNRFNNLVGGTVTRLQRMRNYATAWKPSRQPPHGITWREARKFGIGSIKSDAHGPTFGHFDGANIPASVLDGLRDAGTSEKLAGLDYSGWYADAYQDELYCGHVWQLPARDGEPLYVAGYAERDSGYAMLCASNGRLKTFDDPRDAAIAADDLAQRNAEKEREYSERWQAATRLDDEESEALDHLRMARTAWRVAFHGWINAKNCGANSAATACRDAMARHKASFVDALDDVRNVRAELEAFADVER